MPQRSKRPCRYPGCVELVRDGSYCEKHQKQTDAQYDQRRGSAASRGYGARWRKLRKMFLASHPLCGDPFGHHAEENRLVPATEVDHIKPKQQGGTDRWENLQALCKPCHSLKTAGEGRWG